MIHLLAFLALVKSLIGVGNDEELQTHHWKQMATQQFADNLATRLELPMVCFVCLLNGAYMSIFCMSPCSPLHVSVSAEKNSSG